MGNETEKGKIRLRQESRLVVGPNGDNEKIKHVEK